MVQGEQRRHPRHRVHLRVVVTPPRALASSAPVDDIPELPVTSVVDLSVSGAGLEGTVTGAVTGDGPIEIAFNCVLD